MRQIRFGRSELIITKNAFGALPIQRISKADAAYLLNKALDGGMNFFDTARAYSDSEEKIGEAFRGKRDRFYLATKTAAVTAEAFWKDLETSLRNLQMDYVDLYQFHNPAFCPKPGDGTGLYEAMLKAKEQGKIRFIGITNHRQAVAREAIESNLYDSLQFPFCYLASPEDIAMLESCVAHDMGFISMKGLSGGLLTNAKAAFAFQELYEHTVPIWGVQRECELDEFLSYMKEPPAMTAALREFIAKDKETLAGEFCRSCGYCMPCPKGIEIPQCARMSQLIRRSPEASHLTPRAQAMMKKVEECVGCGQCMKKCPYSLNIPELLKKNYEDYKTFLTR